VTLSKGVLTVNGVRVINNDIQASNGVIHVIDSVLLPTPQKKPVDAVLGLLELAIERGVPLFNDGQQAACASVYEVAARAIADRPEGLPRGAVDSLRKALTTVGRSGDAVENAWTLRRAMDQAMRELIRVSSEESAEMTPGSNLKTGSDRKAGSDLKDSFDLKTVFDFDGTSHDWFTVNDDVMGGISRAACRPTDRGTALFKGALSLENNGGFATIRSPGRDMDLDDYDGLVLRVRGDGRTYGFSALPSSSRREINNWRAEFTTKRGEWMEVVVPFDSLTHTVMGRRFPRSGSLPPSRLRSIAFSISDKNETPFELEIDWVKAYRQISAL
jgi:hypothetical protein